MNLIREQAWKIFAIVGFSSVVISSLSAHNSPALEYELSIIQNTPGIFWVAIGISISVSLVLGLYFRTVRYAIGLGTLSFLSLISLPIIRGFHYIGSDSMTHLGLGKWIIRGGNALDVFYPAMHLLSIYTSFITGFDLPHSFLIWMPVFSLCFIIFVTQISMNVANVSRESGLLIGFYSGFLLFPVNWFGINLGPHPFTYATLISPFAIYLVIRNWGIELNRFIILLLMVAPFYVIIHPQQELNLAIIIGSIAAIQLASSSSKLGSILDDSYVRSRPVLLSSGILLLLGIYYNLFFEKIDRTLTPLVIDIFSGQVRSSGEVASRSASLSQIGISPTELILKIFGPSLVYGLISVIFGIYILKSLYAKNGNLTYYKILGLSLAIIPLTGGVALFFLSDSQLLSLRYVGVIMVLITIIGAVAITQIFDLSGNVKTRTILGLFFALMILISGPTYYATPYIVKPSRHVTEEFMNGYDISFTYRTEGVPIDAVRGPPFRYQEAIYGLRVPHVWESPPDHFNNQSLSKNYTSKRYLAVTQAARQRDIVLYRGLRYTKDDFEYLDRDSGIDKVVSTGEFELYLIHP